MITRINTLSCDHARQLDLVAYLASIGHHPSKTKDCNYWYLSPLRNERTASFKVDGKLNVWYDHGLGKGGNLVDFGILYHQCTVAEFLKKLNETSFLQQPVKTIQPSEESIVKIISEKEISSLSLINYLVQRKISETVAKKYCSEVTFSIRDKIYTAIGFRNNNGGFELRNSWFKGSSAPKTITTLGSDDKGLIVFEGFFDFLSYQTFCKNQELPGADFLILNSLSFFEKSRQYMEAHGDIRLFLDRDKPGIKWTEQALSWSKKYTDESHLYKGYKDLNDWSQHIGKSLKRGLKL